MSVKPVRFASVADTDIDEITEDGVPKYGLAEVNAYIRGLADAVRAIVGNPLLQNQSANTLPNVTTKTADLFCVARYKAHYILYRETTDEAQILAVVRQGRDMNVMLEKLANRIGDDCAS